VRKALANQSNIDWSNVVRECQWCTGGSYVIDTYDGQINTVCSSCPKTASCTAGGLYVRVSPGFWRAYFGPSIYSCPFTDPARGPACLGGYGTPTPSDYGFDYPTPCLYGYQGPLCATCKSGFSNAGSFCQDCSNVGMNGSMLSLILLASLVFLNGLCSIIESVMSGVWSGKVRDGLT